MRRSLAAPGPLPVVWMPVTLRSPTTFPLNFFPTVIVDFKGVDGPVGGASGITAFGETDCWKTLAALCFFLASTEPARVIPNAVQSASARMPTSAEGRPGGARLGRWQAPL